MYSKTSLAEPKTRCTVLKTSLWTKDTMYSKTSLAEVKTLCTAKHLWLKQRHYVQQNSSVNQRHYVQQNISGSSKDTMYSKTSLAEPKTLCTGKHLWLNQRHDVQCSKHLCEPKALCTAKHLWLKQRLCTAKHLWLKQRHYVQQNISGWIKARHGWVVRRQFSRAPVAAKGGRSVNESLACCGSPCQWLNTPLHKPTNCTSSGKPMATHTHTQSCPTCDKTVTRPLNHG